jgi:hypothetical protein
VLGMKAPRRVGDAIIGLNKFPCPIICTGPGHELFETPVPPENGDISKAEGMKKYP